MVVRREQAFLGALGLMDTPRAEARAVIAQLKQLGVQRMIMLTGDNQSVADAIANDVGLTTAGSPAPDSPIVVGGSGEFAYTLREAGGVLAHLWTTRIDPDGRVLKIEAN